MNYLIIIEKNFIFKKIEKAKWKMGSIDVAHPKGKVAIDFVRRSFGDWHVVVGDEPTEADGYLDALFRTFAHQFVQSGGVERISVYYHVSTVELDPFASTIAFRRQTNHEKKLTKHLSRCINEQSQIEIWAFHRGTGLWEILKDAAKVFVDDCDIDAFVAGLDDMSKEYQARRDLDSIIKNLSVVKHQILHTFLPFDQDLQAFFVQDEATRIENARELIDEYNSEGPHAIFRRLSNIQFLIAGHHFLSIPDVDGKRLRITGFSEAQLPADHKNKQPAGEVVLYSNPKDADADSISIGDESQTIIALLKATDFLDYPSRINDILVKCSIKSADCQLEDSEASRFLRTMNEAIMTRSPENLIKAAISSTVLHLPFVYIQRCQQVTSFPMV